MKNIIIVILSIVVFIEGFEVYILRQKAAEVNKSLNSLANELEDFVLERNLNRFKKELFEGKPYNPKKLDKDEF